MSRADDLTRASGLDERTELKRLAAEHAVSFVASGSVIGLGTGSTAVWAVRKVGALLAGAELHDVLAVPTSRETEAEARRLGIPLTTLEDHPVLDLTIDGADEVDPELNLIKGGGGALLHEKIVAQASRREIVVVDEAKLSPVLGTRFALPVEVVPFGQAPATAALERLGASVSLRRDRDGRPFTSDEGNIILDAAFGPITDLAGLAAQLSAQAAVVEHGLFLGLTTDLVVASATGVRHLEAQPRRTR